MSNTILAVHNLANLDSIIISFHYNIIFLGSISQTITLIKITAIRIKKKQKKDTNRITTFEEEGMNKQYIK